MLRVRVPLVLSGDAAISAECDWIAWQAAKASQLAKLRRGIGTLHSPGESPKLTVWRLPDSAARWFYPCRFRKKLLVGMGADGAFGEGLLWVGLVMRQGVSSTEQNLVPLVLCD